MSHQYDRQIDIWGSDGQDRLSKSTLCIIGSKCCCFETAQSLALAGIGKVVVVDSEVVTTEDLQQQFYVEEKHVGSKRGAVLSAFIKDLNSSVETQYLDENRDAFINKLLTSNFLCDISIILAIEFSFTNEVLIRRSAEKYNIPVIFLYVQFPYGSLSSFANSHVIYDTGRPIFFDFRLSIPFPQLRKFSESSSLNKKLESSVLTAVKAASRINKKDSAEEKRLLFRSFIEDDKISLEAKAEACKFFEQEITSKALSEELHNCFKVVELREGEILKLRDDKNFWILAKSLKRFHNLHGAFPMAPPIPDFVSDTESFKKLKNIYQDRIEFEQNSFFEIYQQECLVHGFEAKKEVSVDFCKRARNIGCFSKDNFQSPKIENFAIYHVLRFTNEYSLLKAEEFIDEEIENFKTSECSGIINYTI
eukprot:GHVP01050195.1.p1 GENE.GHVP01050195.1~~GHVP01050195.1.p1  ORF type:complete len:421 (+),score=71.61 GHVP01050195.1:30-1292(+)